MTILVFNSGSSSLKFALLNQNLEARAGARRGWTMKTRIVEESAMSSVLSPEIAALVMSGSSALLAINAPMLKRIKGAGIRRPAGAAATVAAQVPA